jgi:HEAT repeat protein
MRLAMACLVAATVSIFAGPAAAADLPKEMDALVAEGKKWFQESGNTELGTAERNAARVKSWRSLWPAREALDRYEEDHPEDMNRVDAKYGEIRMMIYCLRKESPVGLLEGSGVGPKKGGDDEEDPEPAAPPAAGRTPPMLPPGPAPTPPPAPASPGPVPAAPPAAPVPAAPPKAPGPPAPAVESLMAAAEEYERKHRFDLPGIQARYLKVVAADPDLSSPLARKAAENAGELESRLKDAYRLLRNEDPDSLKGMTNVRIKGMVIAVARDLPDPDPAVRERAARTIGLLANLEGVYYLANALKKETEAAPADAMVEALVRIGGLKSADALADLKDDARHAERALAALIRLSKRNPVDRRIAATRMARFVGARDDELFDRMFKTLQGMGPEGVVGLAAALDHGTTYPRLIKVIGALADTKEPGVARVLSRYFQQGRGGGDDQVRDAAMKAVKKLAKPENAGEAVIPRLFYAVRNVATRVFTTQVLQEITGRGYTVKEWGSWSNWWLESHPGWKDDGKAR